MSKCQGINCGAGAEGEREHSEECVMEYERTIDLDRCSVSLSSMKYWVDRLEHYGPAFIPQLKRELEGYINLLLPLV